MTNRVRILDTTIRDGGYMVNHHYSRSDVATLVGGLDLAGLL
jgi:isopropylmalate/homocitrate/citramalate synthase